jgi:hypothetical protein
MPIIPASPGNWLDLYINTIRLHLNPEGLEQTEPLTKNWDGHAIWALKRYFGDGEKAMVKPAELDLMAQSRQDAIALGARVGDLEYGLVTAGNVLAYVLRLAKDAPRLASVTSAISIVSWRYAGTAFASSATYLRAAWNKYRPISHFVVAADLMGPDYAELAAIFPERPPQPTDEDHLIVGTDWLKKMHQDAPNIKARLDAAENKTFPRFFAIAEKIRAKGQKHFAPNQSTQSAPLLNPAQTWAVPPGFDLPHATIKWPPLTADEIREAAPVNPIKNF